MFNLFFIIHFLVLIFGSLGILTNKEKKYYKVTTIILAILSMIRFDVGYDYFWYWIVGDVSQKNHPVVEKMFGDLEFGIQKIYELTRILGHPQYFFLITGGITFYYIYRGIYRDSLSPILSLVLFMKLSNGFFEANHIVMQYLSIAIIFYYTKLILEKKIKKYITIVFLCSLLFHSSAIICLLFPFVPKKRIRADILFLGNLFIYLNLKIVLPIIVNKILPQYSYLFYYGSDKFSNIGNLKYQILVILTYIVIINCKKVKIFSRILKNKEICLLESYYANLFIIGTLFAFDLEYAFPGDLSRRIGAYFIMYGFVLFGNIFDLFNSRFSKEIKVVLVLFLFLLNIRASFKFQGLVLNKEPYYNEKGDFIARPNSRGFKIFIGRKYKEMSPYLPGEQEFIRK
ncbi:MAG: EpsG family protein [Cetobacterium sp.]